MAEEVDVRPIVVVRPRVGMATGTGRHHDARRPLLRPESAHRWRSVPPGGTLRNMRIDVLSTRDDLPGDPIQVHPPIARQAFECRQSIRRKEREEAKNRAKSQRHLERFGLRPEPVGG